MCGSSTMHCIRPSSEPQTGLSLAFAVSVKTAAQRWCFCRSSACNSNFKTWSSCVAHAVVTPAVLCCRHCCRPHCVRVLLTAYAFYLQPAWFSEASYLWAVELWYAYAIQVKGPATVPAGAAAVSVAATAATIVAVVTSPACCKAPTMEASTACATDKHDSCSCCPARCAAAPTCHRSSCQTAASNQAWCPLPA